MCRTIQTLVSCYKHEIIVLNNHIQKANNSIQDYTWFYTVITIICTLKVNRVNNYNIVRFIYAHCWFHFKKQKRLFVTIFVTILAI